MKKRNPKYNTSRDGTWWPIKQYRFDTRNHPVAIDKTVKANEIQLFVSHNEKQIIDGLANILMCKASTALRIALQEASRVKGEIHNHKGFKPAEHRKKVTKRTYKVKARVPATEAALAAQLANDWDVKVSDVVRICCIELASLIKADKIKSLKGCKKLSQLDCIKLWGEKNKDRPKGSKIKALTQASHTASMKSEDEIADEYAFWGAAMAHSNFEGTADQFNHVEYHNGHKCGEYFDMESFKVWYVQTHMGGGDGEAEITEALASPDREKAIEAIAKQMAKWCDEDENWEEFIEQATEDYDLENREASEEDEDAANAFLDDLFGSPDEGDTSKLEHKGYISKKIMSFDGRDDQDGDDYFVVAD